MRVLRPFVVSTLAAGLAVGLLSGPAHGSETTPSPAPGETTDGETTDGETTDGETAGPTATPSPVETVEPTDAPAPEVVDGPVTPVVEIVTVDDAPVVELEDESTLAVLGEPAAAGAESDHAHVEADYTPDAVAEVDEVLDEHDAVVVEDDEGGVSATVSADTAGLAVVGVSWDAGTAPADLDVQWRSETAAGWTAWEYVHVDEEEAPDEADATAAARDGIPPLGVTDAESVEVRLLSPGGSLPQGLQMGVVDPGASTVDTAPAAAPEAATTTSTTTATTTSAIARPAVLSRSQWGADERMMTWTPSQGRVQGVTIHHTVNANDYTAAEVPALLRGIYAYHAQDWGRGWGDIGYNFIVDRFGRVWEGRAGGIDQAPTGAHATGLNSNFVGISLLGNFDTTAVPAAAFTTVARVAAWKLAMHGVTTSGGTVTVDAGTFARVNGHRDSKSTTCPGRYMYNRLGELRSRISSYLGSFADRQLDRDLDGDGAADLVVTQGGAVSIMSTVDRGSWRTRTLGSSGWTPRTVTPGDFDGDGRNDTILVDAAGLMWLYPGQGSGGLDAAKRVRIGTGWASFTSIVGGADWDGDRRPDLLARHRDGTLRLYTGNGRGGFTGSSLIGRGWNGFTSLSLAPSFVGGRPALLAERAGTAQLWAYPADGDGGFDRSILATSRWASQRQATGVGDATGDGRGDVVSVDTAGTLWLYPGTATGGVDATGRIRIGTGWGSTTIRSHGAAGAEDLALLGIRSTGALTRYGWTYDRRAFEDLTSTGIRVSTGSRVIPVGDWNGDGRADLLVATATGALLLHAGAGGGRFAASGVQVGTGWAGMTAIVGAGNWRGDGLPGLVAYERSAGRLWFYPGNGRGGFGPRVLASNGADGMNHLVNVGRWDLGGAPDLLMRGADSGRLFFYNGNGPGLALPPVVNGQGWGSMRAVVGVNDITGDGRPDVLAVSSSGAVTVYPGNGAGGFGSAVRVGSVGSGAVVS